LSSSTITAATCCPSGFTCRTGRGTDDPNACISTMTSDTSYLGIDVLTYSTGSPTKIGTTSAYWPAGELVFAKGLVAWRAATDAQWPTSDTSLSTTITITGSLTTGPITSAAIESIPTATRTDSFVESTRSATVSAQTASSGLSTQARVGLGVGVSLGTLVIAGAIMAAYQLGKRKTHRSLDNIAVSSSANEGNQDLNIWNYELEEQRRIIEVSSEREPAELMSSYH
ncbi:hypothetical protein GGR53DRAFT_409593, partial [Hypoxylon sp. FL1150]